MDLGNDISAEKIWRYKNIYLNFTNFMPSYEFGKEENNERMGIIIKKSFNLLVIRR